MSALQHDEYTIRDALDIMAHGRPTYDRTRTVRTYANGRVTYSIDGREVYSYGRHFPLLRFVPRGRRRPLIVLNGDEWRQTGPSRTRDHQSMARQHAAALGETCVIPFSALTGAGIDIDSIRPVHTRADERWQETLTGDRDTAPFWVRSSGDQYVAVRDETGRPVLWQWDTWRHRLGDCLFTAVRDESYVRPARPFETSGETARVARDVAWRETYCNVAPDSRHVTGPAGACIHCTRPLQTRVTVRRRGLFLSSFDYQESPPLYFLAEVPRGAGATTVETALDALAPRAVHAAYARGVDVRRQGDVFFVAVPLELADLEQRGIVTRARLTQWTRDARARRGETGYRRPLTAAERRAMERYRRREWRRIFRDAETKVTVKGPASARGIRRRAAQLRAKHSAELHAAELELRRAILGGESQWQRNARRRGYSYGAVDRYSEVQRYTRLTPLQHERRAIAARARDRRAELARLESQSAGIAAHRARARDAYRVPWIGGHIAAGAYSMARTAALVRFYPDHFSGAAIERRRERVRRALAIYGTAHSATEVIRTRSGAVYVRGEVRHVPDLEPGRDGRRDHAPLMLGEGWYLAIRNTVPRQRARRSA